MGHTNQTANYNLPQFVGTDKPSWLGDINDAFAAIDTAIAAAASEASTADGKADALTTTVSGHTIQIGTLQNTVTSQGNTLNTVTSLIGNGTPTTTDQTIIGAINELHADQGDLDDLQTSDKSSLVAAINEAAAGGGGSQSVRYYNGYIQYSTDGGTTWINLINVSTPQQLLPVMTGNTSVVGNAAKDDVTGDAYKSIDGSVADITDACRFGNDMASVSFTFNDATFVKTINASYKGDSSVSSQIRLDHSNDGITWISGTPETIEANDTTERTITESINDTVKAIRIIKVGSSGAFYAGKLEAYN